MKVHNALSDIAHLCPYAGGPAVFMARNMLAMYGPAHYDDENACVQVGYTMRKGIIETNLVGQISVHPNPADGEVMFSGKGLLEERQIKIWDMLGRVQMTIDLPTGAEAVKVNVKHLGEGTYYYTIGSYTKGKFIIQH
jgi:hypothetical protein